MNICGQACTSESWPGTCVPLCKGAHGRDTGGSQGTRDANQPWSVQSTHSTYGRGSAHFPEPRKPANKPHRGPGSPEPVVSVCSSGSGPPDAGGQGLLSEAEMSQLLKDSSMRSYDPTRRAQGCRGSLSQTQWTGLVWGFAKVDTLV